jgi:hypothetical protein
MVGNECCNELTAMPLNLYRRHYRIAGKCIGGHPPDSHSYEPEELRRSWKKCHCPIYADETLGGSSNAGIRRKLLGPRRRQSSLIGKPATPGIRRRTQGHLPSAETGGWGKPLAPCDGRTAARPPGKNHSMVRPFHRYRRAQEGRRSPPRD